MYNFRLFEPKDMFSVIKIASDNLSERYDPSIFNYFFETFPQGFLVATFAQKIIGFIIGIEIETNKAKIVMLSISEDFQGKKIGSKLLKTFEDNLKLQKINNIELEVRTNNKKAINFYIRHDYKIIEKVDEYYQNNESAFIMKKTNL